jgi:hypothetical protein
MIKKQALLYQKTWTMLPRSEAGAAGEVVSTLAGVVAAVSTLEDMVVIMGDTDTLITAAVGGADVSKKVQQGSN